MIVERIEGMVALIRAHILKPLTNLNLDLTTTALFVGVLLGTALIIDYGYMIYLHYKMVRPIPQSPKHQNNIKLKPPSPQAPSPSL